MTSNCLLRITRNLFKQARHQIRIGHDPQLQEKESDRARKHRREKRKKDVRTFLCLPRHSQHLTCLQKQKRRLKSASTYRMPSGSEVPEEFLDIRYMSDEYSEVEDVEKIVPRINRDQYLALKGSRLYDTRIPEWRDKTVSTDHPALAERADNSQITNLYIKLDEHAFSTARALKAYNSKHYRHSNPRVEDQDFPNGTPRCMMDTTFFEALDAEAKKAVSEVTPEGW